MPGAEATITVRPRSFIDSDLPWLSALLEDRERFVGRKRREWKARIEDGLPVDAPRQKLLVALRVLDRLARDAAHGGPPARVLRATLFREAARSADRAAAAESAASKLGIEQHVLMACLFSDLPDERVLTAIAPTTPEQLALLGNSELIAKLLTRALRVRIWANGHVRALVRQAKLMGLLCNVTGAANDESILDRIRAMCLPSWTRVLTPCCRSRLRSVGALDQKIRPGCS